MRTYRPRPNRHTEEDQEDTTSEIEEDIKPPLQRRLVQTLIALLLITSALSVIIAKVMTDQRQQATQAADRAIAAQATAVAQVTALANDVRSNAATPVPLHPNSLLAEVRSRGLAFVALEQLQVDPERALLIALDANQNAHTPEAADALRHALREFHLRLHLSGSKWPILTAEFSPGGDAILTTSSFGPAQVWDAHTGKELYRLGVYTDVVLSAQYSPLDGKEILTAVADNTARLWNADTGALVAILSGHTDRIQSARFSSDGRRIATGSLDNTVRIWNTADIAHPLILNGHPSGVRTVEWSSDGVRVLATDWQGLSVWDTLTGKLLFRVRNDQLGRLIQGARFSPDGKELVIVGAALMRVLDAYTGQPLQTFSGTYADDAQFSPDGNQLLAGEWLWDVRIGQRIFSFPRRYGFEPLFTSDGTLLITQGDLRTLIVWNVRTASGPPRQVATLRGSRDIYAIHLSPDDQFIVSVATDGSGSVWAIKPDDTLPTDDIALLALAKARVTRELTCEERQTYLHEIVNCA